MKIAICDDALDDAKRLKAILQSHQSMKSADICIFNKSREFLNYIKNNPTAIDIAFLDIDMPEMTGLELAKSIKSQNPNILLIFATSYAQYMLNAFDVEAFHYIVKPFDAEKVLSIAEKAYQKHLQSNRYHLIKIQNQSLRLSINEIFYIEYCQKHVIYYTSDRKIETSDALGEVYSALKDYGFYQIHQGYIVNMEKIDHFDGYSAVLIDGRSVAISVRKKSEVLLAYSEYIRRH